MPKKCNNRAVPFFKDCSFVLLSLLTTNGKCVLNWGSILFVRLEPLTSQFHQLASTWKPQSSETIRTQRAITGLDPATVKVYGSISINFKPTLQLKIDWKRLHSTLQVILIIKCSLFLPVAAVSLNTLTIHCQRHTNNAVCHRSMRVLLLKLAREMTA